MPSAADVLDRIDQAGTAWVRVAAVRPDFDRPWKVKLLEVTTGEPPPAWEPRCWEYPLALFDGYVGPGERVAEMLRSGSVEVCGVEVGTAKEIQVVSDERRQSGAQAYSFQTLDWPADEWRLSVLGTEQASDPPDHMISDGDAPSFVNFHTAISSFFRRPEQSAGTVTQEAVYRHQDRTGRFNSVRMIVADDALELEIEGDRLDGLVVELAGTTPGTIQTLDGRKRPGGRPETRSVSFELDGGLPSGAWVLLRRGTEWIDRRFLTVPFTRQGEAGVEIIADQATRLEALVGDWERVGVEFKRQMPAHKEKESRLKMMKTVCAFANGEGGSLLIGVDDEDRTYVGVDPKALDSLQRQLDHMVRSWIDPHPDTHFETLPIPESEKVVLELVVDPGSTLFVCGQTGETRRPYVRHHSSTEVASRSEILTITQQGAQVPGPGWIR